MAKVRFHRCSRSLMNTCVLRSEQRTAIHILRVYATVTRIHTVMCACCCCICMRMRSSESAMAITEKLTHTNIAYIECVSDASLDIVVVIQWESVAVQFPSCVCGGIYTTGKRFVSTLTSIAFIRYTQTIFIHSCFRFLKFE